MILFIYSFLGAPLTHSGLPSLLINDFYPMGSIFSIIRGRGVFASGVYPTCKHPPFLEKIPWGIIKMNEKS